MTQPRTALVIAIPEADARFGDLRRRFDPQAGLGVPAHITILFPFMPPEQIDDGMRRRLARLFKRHSPFRCVLNRVGRFAATAFLAPALPARFIELAAAVAREFPEYLPYEGAHPSTVPHLTIAHGDPQSADAAERELRLALERDGPVSVHCGTVTLLENATGTWRTMHDFALVGHQG
jgi:2'-5' RNA ligase